MFSIYIDSTYSDK